MHTDGKPKKVNSLRPLFRSDVRRSPVCSRLPICPEAQPQWLRWALAPCNHTPIPIMRPSQVGGRLPSLLVEKAARDSASLPLRKKLRATHSSTQSARTSISGASCRPVSGALRRRRSVSCCTGAIRLASASNSSVSVRPVRVRISLSVRGGSYENCFTLSANGGMGV